jgi:hypothetical protein
MMVFLCTWVLIMTFVRFESTLLQTAATLFKGLATWKEGLRGDKASSLLWSLDYHVGEIWMAPPGGRVRKYPRHATPHPYKTGSFLVKAIRALATGFTRPMPPPRGIGAHVDETFRVRFTLDRLGV